MDLAVLPHEWHARRYGSQMADTPWLRYRAPHSLDGGATATLRDEPKDDVFMAAEGWACVDLEVEGDFVQRLGTFDAREGDDCERPCARVDAAAVLLRPQ